MGCVSSKLVKKEVIREIHVTNGGDKTLNHVVSLTSSTYGALNLDTEKKPIKENIVSSITKLQEPEIINAWELMEGLEDSGVPAKNSSPKPRISVRGISSPYKMESPRKVKRVGGKENRGNGNGNVNRCLTPQGNRGLSPKQVLKPKSCTETPKRGVLRLSFPTKSEDSVPRKSLSPLFDPDLVASYEKELFREQEQIKMIISPAPDSRKLQQLGKILIGFEEKCPPGGENSIVIYTTTLRGIRKTFENCNTVRSIIESHGVHVVERDVSMDSGFRDEIRKLMGTKEVRVPVVFVKGRLIGGVDEVVKMEDEGKLGVLIEGIPKGRVGGCEGCGGVRFVMCMECNGSCKVIGEDQKMLVRCGECNENGLIQCPICC